MNVDQKNNYVMTSEQIQSKIREGLLINREILDLDLDSVNQFIIQTNSDKRFKQILKELYLADKIIYAYKIQNKTITAEYNSMILKLEEIFNLPKMTQKAVNNLIQDLFGISTKRRALVYKKMNNQLRKMISTMGIIQKMSYIQKASPQQRKKIIQDQLNRVKLSGVQMRQKHDQVIRNRTTYNNQFQENLWNCKNWGQVWDLHHRIQSQLDDTLIKHFLLGYHYEAISLHEKGTLRPNLQFMIQMP